MGSGRTQRSAPTARRGSGSGQGEGDGKRADTEARPYGRERFAEQTGRKQEDGRTYPYGAQGDVRPYGKERFNEAGKERAGRGGRTQRSAPTAGRSPWADKNFA